MIRTFVIACSLLVFAWPAFGLEKPGEELTEAVITTKLGAQVDLGSRFTTSNGKQVALKDLVVNDKPVILIPVYYDCPRLCGLVLKGITRVLNELALQAGRDFSIVTFSFDPEEKPPIAARRAKYYRESLKPQHNKEFWHFLVGEQDQISKTLSDIGFRAKKDKDEFAHTAALMILTPDGIISQYLTGIEYSAFDLRLALVEASGGKVGNPIDHVLLFCFRFDPTKGKYTWAAFGVMRAGGVLTLLLLGGLLFRLWRRERVKKPS